MKKMNKKGFTIVELVIVIAVIAILSAVLIPTFSGVIGEANKTAVVADAKAVYQQYVSEETLAGREAKKNLIYVDTGKNLVVVIENGQIGDAFEKEADALKELDDLFTAGTAGKKAAKGEAIGTAGLYDVVEAAAA